MSPSSGHTCAARARRGELLAFLLVAVQLQSGVVAAFAAPTILAPLPNLPTPSIPLSLGFGPSSLSPLSDGVPVYTVGDTIWAASGFNYSVPLSVTSAKAGASAPAVVATTNLLGPKAIVPLHTFASTDTDGVWNITVGSKQGTSVIPLHFVKPADHPVSLGPLQYSLDGGNMSISAQANLGDSYDQEVCAGGTAARAGVSLSLPPEMQDSGGITLIPGSPFTIVTSGKVNASSSFWFELYHPYALAVTSTNSVVVRDLMTAASRPVALVSNSTSTTTLAWNMAPREGRYELRAYFQNSTSLDVLQSRVLIVNDSSWVSLSTPCRPLAIDSQSISYSGSLTDGQDNWPRVFYVMYRTFGVESVVSYPVRANLSSLSFVAIPWNRPLQDIKVNVSPAAGIVQTSQEGSSLFLLASRYPVRLDYTLDIGGGRGVAQGSVAVNEKYSTQTSTLSMAQLTVRVLGDQGSPATVQVAGTQGVSITRALVGSNRTLSFILPTGSYTVTASEGGDSQSAQVGLTDGLAATVSLDLNTFLTLEIILVVTAIMAAVANVLVWVVGSRGISSRLTAK